MTKEEMRPQLRDCPFCHTKGNDDESLHFVENHAVYNGGSYAASYSIFCTGCGVALCNESRDDLLRLWNEGVRHYERVHDLVSVLTHARECIEHYGTQASECPDDDQRLEDDLAKIDSALDRAGKKVGK